MDDMLAETLAGWRRHLHAHPELSQHEKATSAFVCARLDELGIPYVAGIGGHGVVATLSRGSSNRSVGLRADMDALPVTEATGVPYASTCPGVMHACGHDGHTVSLLGAAALLLRDPDWTGTVQLVFQPAEEGYGGAQGMLDDGLLQRFPMERVFAYHNWPGLPAGTVAVHDGPVMAGAARLGITLEGHAGHAGMPHLARDPMLAAGHLVVALQSVVSRNIDPLESAVVSICTVDGGNAANQIPSRVNMNGTIRTFRPHVRAQVDAAIARVVNGIAATFGMQATLDCPPGIEATVNHPAEVEIAAAVVREAGFPLRRDLPPAMTGEDFGLFLKQRPGAFLWIGNGPSDNGRELHNPAYDFNDAILPVAATTLAGIARRALQAGA
ncbi:Amidohydrolase [Rhodovastum atsumiense]|uniref:Amidohydrolase n=1 Tax=Rhodovastum atsumiense TaxID=504468 RepID=A0A5M6IM42_9PROT|nr:amidohydrolase [Rhodovastum atsumiense]KAA5609354.1 amidohydrolase [Rhodovastum atsumiense]CAH2605073.1 Amidohydrolase [Rhodovastum atsumiense]